MLTHAQLDDVECAARRFLGSDFLAERASRIAVLAEWVAGFAEFRDIACNRRAVRAAVWFHDAWCCEELRAGRCVAPHVLVAQPTEVQRERAADALREVLGVLIDGPTLAVAVRAIRQAGDRETHVPEAQILGEAVNLDSIGPLWVLGQVARCSAENRSAASAVAMWERQAEYRYWSKRIDETLRFERSRVLARHRSEVLDGYFAALRDQLTGGDRHVAPETRG